MFRKGFNMFVELKTVRTVMIALFTIGAAFTQNCISQEPTTEALQLPKIVTVVFGFGETQRSVSIDFYHAYTLNNKWQRGAYIDTLRTSKNGNINNQVIRGTRFLDGGSYWAQLNYKLRSGEQRTYCLVIRQRVPVVFPAGWPNTTLQPPK